MFGDAAGIKEHATAMNAGDLYPLFAAMLTQRPWEQVRRALLRTGFAAPSMALRMGP